MVVQLNNKQKNEYSENLNVATNSKPFWDVRKLYFSNKHKKGDSIIVLIEKHEILLKNKKIADVLNSYFESVTDLLNLFSWTTQIKNESIDAVQNIKQFVNNQAKFSFQQRSEHRKRL